MKDTIRQTKSVALVDLGENLSIKLVKLARKLNSLQKSWRFQVVPGRPYLGDPDVESVWYYVDRLFSELAAHKPAADFDIVIGITHVGLENRDSSLGVPDKDYFSLNDRKRLAVITEAASKWNSPNKTLYQYFAFLTIAEVLEIAAGTGLFHQSKEVCLFDDCADRGEFRLAIERSRICTQSQHALREAQVSDSTVTDVHNVLSWCRGTTVGRSIETTIASPVTSLVVGAAIGWATSVFVGPHWYGLVIAVTFLLVFVVFLSNRYRPRLSNR